MSVAEILKELPKLSAEERGKLSVYLRYLKLKDDPEYRAELGRRLKRMKKGELFSMEQIKEMVIRLESANPAMETSLGEDWNRPEEDEAWAYLQERKDP